MLVNGQGAVSASLLAGRGLSVTRLNPRPAMGGGGETAPVRFLAKLKNGKE